MDSQCEDVDATVPPLFDPTVSPVHHPELAGIAGPLARQDRRHDNQDVETGDPIGTCGYSNVTIILAIIVGILALVFLFGIAPILLSRNIPVVGSSSAAGAASCHPHMVEVDAYLDRIGWGVEMENSGDLLERTQDTLMQHLSLTSGATRPP
ncbi:hypothetical protein S40293_04499 [Stachybotrys chartarum IBT 40293]|nr:hypothetical protein S40293_04499 [Stachybotrys chartarum IBT 40293]